MLRPISGIVLEASIAHKDEIDIGGAERMLIPAYYKRDRICM